jgi:hypothetical protein
MVSTAAYGSPLKEHLGREPVIRYRLDELGAYQFEWLVQSLLKVVVGPGVESWGGRGDHGRDSFSKGPLTFPDRSVSTPGPFFFQVKFVENANAAGAKPIDALKGALYKEKANISRRIELGLWAPPKHYVFISNALLPPDFRNWAKQSLVETIGPVEVHFLSGSDICDFLDQDHSIRQAFPQILGLRDLSDLIQSAVNKTEIEKSRSAIDCAKDIAPVFVPTRAYSRAWRVLSEHAFVVLEGPAEMGKSAIAWMIALAQVANGWEAIYCRDPDTFFARYDSGRSQVFIADDAFGLTEYDPTRSQKWENELALVTRQLDTKHWLIWTSRKHIFERALQKLDFKRISPDFPEPSAIMVNAEDLTQTEKAVILYRHAKLANLPLPLRVAIRKAAREIVTDANFTPERIRKLTKEVLPKYKGVDVLEENTNWTLWKDIREVIANPTERSKTTFRALPPGHKWMLISMLENGAGSAVAEVIASYQRLCPEANQEPVGDVLDQLTESFIKRTEATPSIEPGQEMPATLSWVHPSYRDLVIEELARETPLSNRFLSFTDLEGLKLAISSEGGRGGERRLPFLTSERAWELLTARCRTLAETIHISELSDFLETLSDTVSAMEGLESERHAKEMLSDLCGIVRNRWNDGRVILRAYAIEAYTNASLLLAPLQPSPNLQDSWDAAVRKCSDEIESSQSYFFPDEVDSFLQLVKAVLAIEPRLVRQNNFPDRYQSDFEELFQMVKPQLSEDLSEEELDDLRTDLVRFKAMRDLAVQVSELIPNLAKDAKELIASIETKIEKTEELVDSLEEPEPDYDPAEALPSEVDFNLLFSDL